MYIKNNKSTKHTSNTGTKYAKGHHERNGCVVVVCRYSSQLKATFGRTSRGFEAPRRTTHISEGKKNTRTLRNLRKQESAHSKCVTSYSSYDTPKKKLFSANNGSDPTPNGRLRNREGMPSSRCCCLRCKRKSRWVGTGREMQLGVGRAGFQPMVKSEQKSARPTRLDLRFDSSPYQSQSRDGYRPGYKTWYKKSPDVPRVVWHEVRAEARGKSAKNMNSYGYGMILRCTSHA